MSALEEIKRKLNHELTYIEYLIIENENRETTSTLEGAAKELADYELRLDLLAKGATWEHEENERLKEENSALRARVEGLCAILYEINSMNDTANLEDAELWNINGETQKRVDAALAPAAPE